MREDGDRDPNQQEVQQARGGHCDVRRQKDVEHMRGVEDADLEGGEPGDSAELIGVPDREAPLRDLREGRLVVRVVVDEKVDPSPPAVAGVGQDDAERPETHDHPDQQESGSPERQPSGSLRHASAHLDDPALLRRPSVVILSTATRHEKRAARFLPIMR